MWWKNNFVQNLEITILWRIDNIEIKTVLKSVDWIELNDNNSLFKKFIKVIIVLWFTV